MLSIIIAHHPERDDFYLENLRAGIRAQLNKLNIKGEILIESDGSKSESRNKAAQKSQGEILVFLDDDVRLRRDFLQEIMVPFRDPSVGVVGGVNVAFPDVKGSERVSAVLMGSALLWFKSSARYTPRGGIRETDESEIIGCCMAVRKKAFLQAGGFPLDVIPCEENVLIHRIQILGWKVLYNPFATVYHKRASFPGGYARKVFDYGTGRGRMMRKSLFMGAPRSFWKPSWRWILYFLGFWIHHICYFGGIFYGYFIKKNYQESDE